MGFLESLKTSWERGGVRAGRDKYFIATGRVVRLGNRVAVAHTEMVNDAAS